MRRSINYIISLGVELEGGWQCRCGDHRHTHCGCPEGQCDCEPTSLDYPPGCLPLFREAYPHDDSSVCTDAQWNGEISCGPFAVDDPWARRLNSIWPHEVDSTCGLHVHMGCRNHDVYARFMTPAFETHLVNRLTTWGRLHRVDLPAFWSRLAGHNDFCGRGFSGDAQANDAGKSGERYRACNYAWLHKGTLEIRVLPMFPNAVHGLSAIREMLRLSNDWARTHRVRQRVQTVCLWDDHMASAIHGASETVLEVLDLDGPDCVQARTEDLFTCA
jgi:hypothetical protein